MQNPWTVAAGAYLRRLRDHKRWTRLQVEQAVQEQFGAVVTGSTVRQIEEGKVRDGAKLAMVNFVVDGESRYLDGLLLLWDAPAEYGSVLAEAQLAVEDVRGRSALPQHIRALAALLAVYDDAVQDRDVAAQRDALMALVEHFRGPATAASER